MKLLNMRQGIHDNGQSAEIKSRLLLCENNYRASDFPFQKKQFSFSKKVKFRFDSISLLATLNSIKITISKESLVNGPSKWHNQCGELKKKGTISMVNGRKRTLLTREWTIKEAQHNPRCVWTTKRTKQS